MLSVFAILHIHVRTTSRARVCNIVTKQIYISETWFPYLIRILPRILPFCQRWSGLLSLPPSPFVERILLQCFERRYKDSNRCNSVDSFHTFIVAKRSVSFPYIRVIVECLRVTIVRKGMHNSKNGDILWNMHTDTDFYRGKETRGISVFGKVSRIPPFSPRKKNNAKEKKKMNDSRETLKN